MNRAAMRMQHSSAKLGPTLLSTFSAAAHLLWKVCQDLAETIRQGVLQTSRKCESTRAVAVV